MVVGLVVGDSEGEDVRGPPVGKPSPPLAFVTVGVEVGFDVGPSDGLDDGLEDGALEGAGCQRREREDLDVSDTYNK